MPDAQASDPPPQSPPPTPPAAERAADADAAVKPTAGRTGGPDGESVAKPAEQAKRGQKSGGSGKSSSTAGDGKRPRGTSFAPNGPNDGRELGEWQSRYADRRAVFGIFLEATYLCLLLLAIPCGLYWLYTHKVVSPNVSSEPTDPQRVVGHFLLAWLGGALGGTLFSTKWLYHSVAKYIWNEDRRLWRLFTPPLSAGLAFATYALATSGVLPVIDRKSVETPGMALSIGFIVGYFSDSATAKLAEVAETLFGSSRK